MNERLQMVIDEVKLANKNSNSWIFNDGKMCDNVVCANILPILYGMNKYMADNQSADTISYIINNYDSANNTYNFNAPISNDFMYSYITTDNGIEMIFAVHLYGDIRSHYSDFIVLHFDSIEEFYELENFYQCIEIQNTPYVADINCFSESYNVYNCEKQEDVGYFYDIDVVDLLNSIEKEI